MKTVLLACLSLCLASGIVAVAQSPLNQATQEHQAEGSRLSTILGTFRADGQTLTFVTDQRAWSVDNPEILKGQRTLPASVRSRLPGQGLDSHHRSEAAYRK
jgi:hypothetical protein